MKTYAEFRTGLTYGDVYHLIYARKYKRRRGVLGAWRQIKQAMYREYVESGGEQSGMKYVPDESIPIPE